LLQGSNDSCDRIHRQRQKAAPAAQNLLHGHLSTKTDSRLPQIVLAEANAHETALLDEPHYTACVHRDCPEDPYPTTCASLSNAIRPNPSHCGREASCLRSGERTATFAGRLAFHRGVWTFQPVLAKKCAQLNSLTFFVKIFFR
jgi:hypothetical protein